MELDSREGARVGEPATAEEYLAAVIGSGDMRTSAGDTRT